MNEFSTFFTQAYWWLSLFGGLHCFALAFYIRFIYTAGDNQRLLAGFLALTGFYFLTGMLNHDNTPIPIHVLFSLINPIYFLLMPLLYLYCQRTLEPRTAPIGFSKHYWPSLIILCLAAIDISVRLFLHKNSLWSQIPADSRLPNDVNHWALVLPILLMLQTAAYFIALWRLFSRHRLTHLQRNDGSYESLRLIHLRWLLGLTLVMLLNWLIRVFTVVLPFYLGDSLSTLSRALPHLTLLLSFYLLAAYGLKQITRAAYLRGHLATPPKPEAPKVELLSTEELEFIQELQNESGAILDEPAQNDTNSKN